MAQLPNIIDFVNLAIGVSDYTNSSLNFTNNQYLALGEKSFDTTSNLQSNIYNLIVDNQGIGINTSFAAKSLDTNSNALFVNGGITTQNNSINCGSGTLYANNITTQTITTPNLFISSSNINQYKFSIDSNSNISVNNINIGTTNRLPLYNYYDIKPITILPGPLGSYRLTLSWMPMSNASYYSISSNSYLTPYASNLTYTSNVFIGAGPGSNYNFTITASNVNKLPLMSSTTDRYYCY
jgi:hypothetical protein